MVKPCSFSFRWRPRVTCAVSMRWRIHVSSYPCLRQVGTCRSHQDVKPDSISEASQHEASMSISMYCSRVSRLASSSINWLLSRDGDIVTFFAIALTVTGTTAPLAASPDQEYQHTWEPQTPF